MASSRAGIAAPRSEAAQLGIRGHHVGLGHRIVRRRPASRPPRGRAARRATRRPAPTAARPARSTVATGLKLSSGVRVAATRVTTTSSSASLPSSAGASERDARPVGGAHPLDLEPRPLGQRDAVHRRLGVGQAHRAARRRRPRSGSNPCSRSSSSAVCCSSDASPASLDGVALGGEVGQSILDAARRAPERELQLVEVGAPLHDGRLVVVGRAPQPCRRCRRPGARGARRRITIAAPTPTAASTNSVPNRPMPPP